MKNVAVELLEILACFFIGAIPFAKVAMWGTGIDITKTGSKNPGFNNVLRVCREFGIRSKNPRAALALVGDISKAYVALALFAPGHASSVQWMMGIAAVIGHCWNPFLGWNGGKGVATTSGMLLYLVHWQLMLTLILYPTLRMFGRRMGWKQEGAISSMTTMFVLSTLVLIYKGTESGLFAYATLLIVVVRHRSNIREILS
ncbi:MAG TPA: glycerol-3-phosphate acyltransferase [Terriglobia bacterium]|nr:glycerol-3-phosphate acyltransferase [Terriglobia bacterium]